MSLLEQLDRPTETIPPEEAVAAVIESPSNAHAYIEYWKQLAEEQPGTNESGPNPIGPADEAKIKLSKLRAQVIIAGRSPDRQLFMEAETEPTVEAGVTEWYSSLGSLNPLNGAEADLYRGASRLLGVKEGESDGSANSELATLAKYVMERKSENLPVSETLLTAGCLLHEAAIVVENTQPSPGSAESQKKQLLFGLADRIYRRIVEDKTNSWAEDYKQDAAQYSSSLRFHLVSSEARRLEKAPDFKESDQRYQHIKMQYAGLQIEDIDNLLELEAISAFRPANQQDRQFQSRIKNVATSWFVAAASRQRVFERRTFGEFEIDKAFPRQTTPHDPLSRMRALPKRSFSLVADQYNSQGELIEHQPLNVRTNPADRRKFVAPIHTLEIRNLSTRSLFAMARAMKNSYHKSINNKANQDLVAAAQDIVAESLAEAA